MNRKNNKIRSFVAALQGDTPVQPGIPLIEIAGEGRVLIENHYGVTEYGCERICVRVKYGSVYVMGKRLELSLLSRQQLVITGCIDTVGIERR